MGGSLRACASLRIALQPLRRAPAAVGVAGRRSGARRARGRSRSRSDWRYGPYGPPTSGPSSQSRPSQRSESKICCSDVLDVARPVGVLDAQDELAAVALGERQVEQGDVGRADVRVARRGGRDAQADRDPLVAVIATALASRRPRRSTSARAPAASRPRARSGRRSADRALWRAVRPAHRRPARQASASRTGIGEYGPRATRPLSSRYRAGSPALPTGQRLLA